MVTKMARLGLEISCVPISYYPREGETKINPIMDGMRILWMFMKNLTWKPEAEMRTAEKQGVTVKS